MTGRYLIALRTKDGGTRAYPLGPKQYAKVGDLCERLGVTVEELTTMCVGPVAFTLTDGSAETFTMNRHTSRCLRYGAKLAGHDVGAYMWQHLIVERAGCWAAHREALKLAKQPEQTIGVALEA